MEKRTPQCQLTIVKRMITEKGSINRIVSRGGRELGLDEAGIISVVPKFNHKGFYKSILPTPTIQFGKTYTDQRLKWVTYMSSSPFWRMYC